MDRAQARDRGSLAHLLEEPRIVRLCSQARLGAARRGQGGGNPVSRAHDLHHRRRAGLRLCRIGRPPPTHPGPRRRKTRHRAEPQGQGQLAHLRRPDLHSGEGRCRDQPARQGGDRDPADPRGPAPRGRSPAEDRRRIGAGRPAGGRQSRLRTPDGGRPRAPGEPADLRGKLRARRSQGEAHDPGGWRFTDHHLSERGIPRRSSRRARSSPSSRSRLRGRPSASAPSNPIQRPRML